MSGSDCVFMDHFVVCLFGSPTCLVVIVCLWDHFVVCLSGSDCVFMDHFVACLSGSPTCLVVIVCLWITLLYVCLVVPLVW